MEEYTIIAAATKAAVTLGINADELVRAVVARMKAKHGGRGGGGGRPDYAEGKWIEGEDDAEV